MHKYFSQSKYVLAHTNFADESKYTHPNKEYITARWTDALACGCTVIGQQPKSDYAYQKYIWSGAVTDIDLSDRCVNGSQLIDTLKNWSPEIASHNYIMSLKQLDWRWRFKEIADFFFIEFKKLNNELQCIKNSTLL